MDFDCYSHDKKLWLTYVSWETSEKEEFNVSIYYNNELLKRLHSKNLLSFNTLENYEFEDENIILNVKNFGASSTVYLKLYDRSLTLLENLKCE